MFHWDYSQAYSQEVPEGPMPPVQIFTFFYSKPEEKGFSTDRGKTFPEFNILPIYSLMQFRFVTVVPRYVTVPLFTACLYAVILSCILFTRHVIQTDTIQNLNLVIFIF